MFPMFFWTLLSVLSVGHSMVFLRVARIAPNEVTVQLVKCECLPVLFYGLEACSLRKCQYKSINYVINSTFRKNFQY